MIYPRDLAIRVLTRVLSDQVPLDDAILSVGTLAPEARHWLLEVCSGTLRWKGRLDLVVDSTALKKKPSGWLRKALLLAAYQLVAQDRTQPGAVVSETVDLVRGKEGEAPAKFANACLRKVAEHAAHWRAMPLEEGLKGAPAAAWASVPEWLWWKLEKQRGREWAKAYAIASLERPTLWIRTREKGATPVPPGGAITDMKGFAEGEFFVQDVSSQTLVSDVSRICKERASPVAKGKRALTAYDLCGAPGGKAMGLAWEGFDVSATDGDESRLGLIRENVKRLKTPIQVMTRTELDKLPPADLVWVDAPCTGSGIVRRHPDVRWIRQEKDVAGLAKIQTDILKKALEKVAPGGFLMYSVCSVLQEEGPQVVQSVVPKENFEKLQEWLLAPQDAPHGDGFWGALFQRLQ